MVSVIIVKKNLTKLKVNFQFFYLIKSILISFLKIKFKTKYFNLTTI